MIKKYIFKLICISILLVSYSCSTISKSKSVSDYLFTKDNLIPWSIVGFDVKERTPIERLEMLKRLGYKQYAYGYRPKHIPTMAQEWQLAKEKRIAIKAVWLYVNLNKDKVGALRTDAEVVFKNLEKTGLRTQIWVGFYPKYFENIVIAHNSVYKKGSRSEPCKKNALGFNP